MRYFEFLHFLMQTVIKNYDLISIEKESVLDFSDHLPAPP